MRQANSVESSEEIRCLGITVRNAAEGVLSFETWTPAERQCGVAAQEKATIYEYIYKIDMAYLGKHGRGSMSCLINSSAVPLQNIVHVEMRLMMARTTWRTGNHYAETC